MTFELRQLRQEAGREVEKGEGGWVSGGLGVEEVVIVHVTSD